MEPAHAAHVFSGGLLGTLTVMPDPDVYADEVVNGK
jgi:hypothetical protein